MSYKSFYWKHDTAFVHETTSKVCEYARERRSYKREKNTGRQLYNNVTLIVSPERCIKQETCKPSLSI